MDKNNKNASFVNDNTGAEENIGAVTIMSATGENNTNSDKKPVDAIIAALMLLAGYMLVSWVFVDTVGIGATVFTLISVISAIVFVCIKKDKPSKSALFMLAFSVALSLSFTLSANQEVKACVFMLNVCIYVYFVYASCGNRAEGRICDSALTDFGRALAMLFKKPTALFSSLSGKLYSASV